MGNAVATEAADGDTVLPSPGRDLLPKGEVSGYGRAAGRLEGASGQRENGQEDDELDNAAHGAGRTVSSACSIFPTSTEVLKQGPKGRSLRTPRTGSG